MAILFTLIGYVVYGAMASLALWGAFCLILTWRRVTQTRFRNEAEQNEFFEELEPPLNGGKFDVAAELCDDDRRAMPQLALYAIENRKVGMNRLQRRLVERFQQDVLADIEHRLSWVSTVSKSAPMIGLFGTVIGMMGAFSNLSSGAQVDTGKMAEDIMFALITTAMGLAIAVPLVLGSASINIQIRKMEDLVSVGLARLLDNMRTVVGRG
ncbi:colicin uptake protein TolQ [Posidoniimonas polymericola]|uniref:Colicin uptake protein TolQ n=1 Tax=Posidoniimonas polymericola TaxID=2528002 RepID=A0A5C5YM15_9BACT|nr:MotA/TolQ/ExbB proton channel family protein [Posidoniimonas polymericola]TWT75859.1 colicin uptake protein TolQ [Posidoniimonas polymericola]